MDAASLRIYLLVLTYDALDNLKDLGTLSECKVVLRIRILLDNKEIFSSFHSELISRREFLF